jgi:hypothetical protein
VTYYEKHHIIPRCLGGADDKDNLVLLTAREHFLCHKLLCKIYPNNKKLVFALWRMCVPGRNYQHRYKITSKEYEMIRIKMANAISSLLTGRQYVMTENRIDAINKRKGKSGRALSAETKKKISDAAKLRKDSDETRMKKSIANKGQKRSLDFINKCKRPKSETHKQNLSKSHKERWNRMNQITEIK